MFKVCSTCNENKEIHLFSLKRNKPNARCKACVSVYYKKYRELNSEKDKERHTKYWEKTKGTEVQKANNKKKCKTYQSKNLQKFKLYEANRRAKQKQATPIWANVEEITNIYLNCPEGYDVDHIIPINSKIVCGLHVENNLQYLLSSENKRKSNKFPYIGDN